MGPLIGVVLLVWALTTLWEPSSVTVYAKYCEAAKCTPSTRVVYKAVAQGQTVTYQTDSWPPQQLKACSVMDSRNWSCGEDFTMAMIDGEIKERIESINVKQIGAIHWWVLRLREWAK